MWSLRDTYKSYIIFEINMLSVQILVQSFSWIHFDSIFLLNLMLTMLSTQISYKYHIYAHSVYLRDTYKSHIIFEIYHVKYTDICSILYLDTFSFHISVKSHVYNVKYTDFI